MGGARSELERRELELVLSSEEFRRAPGLSQILSYICAKHFEGADDEIKEYTVGVDALGRPVGFDQKDDAIVRVQVGRLRRRLKQYYAKAGASDPVRIEVPEGAYRPRFVVLDPLAREGGPEEQNSSSLTKGAPGPGPEEAAPSLPDDTPQSASGEAAAFPTSGREGTLLEQAGVPLARRRRLVWLTATAGLAAAAIVGMLNLGDPAPSLVVSMDQEPIAQTLENIPRSAGSESLRILAGLESGEFTDGFGSKWGPDRFYEGGSVVRLTDHPIHGTRDPELYQLRRQGLFSYRIPLPPGAYELRLHFAETHYGEKGAAGFGGEGSRAFSVSLNGQVVQRRLDVLGEVGGNTANVKVFTNVSPSQDGKLHIEFSPLAGVPILSAIEVTPGDPSGHLRPIRLVAQDRAYTDPAGQRWESDRLARGGQVVHRRAQMVGASDPGLYAGERFGNFSYLIPVSMTGVYRINLYMAEQWIGPGLPGQGGPGSRVFDILCNGVALQRNVDVTALAGGPNRPLLLSFDGIKPTPQGKIWLTFLPIGNFPIINALEVIDESAWTGTPPR